MMLPNTLTPASMASMLTSVQPMNMHFNDIFRHCKIKFSYNNCKYELSCTTSKVLICNHSSLQWQKIGGSIEIMFNDDRNAYVGPHNVLIPCYVIDHLLIKNNVKAPIPCSN